MLGKWEEWQIQEAMDNCESAGGWAEVYERDNGEVYPMCTHTGIFYAPPFHLGALAELLWPEAWGTVPPL